jgi:hypothetical protein
MSVGERVQECINKLEINDAENAFIQLSIAIDGTAKNEYPGKKTSFRCKKFLRENLPFVMWSLTNGTPSTCKDFKFEFSSDGYPNGMTSFEDIIYSVLRCSLLHEGEMPEKVNFINESYIAMVDGKMQFPIALIGSLLFAVIASPSNKNQNVSKNSHFMFGEVKAYVNDMWGSEDKTRGYIRNGFEYDVEKLLEIHNKSMQPTADASAD